MNFTPLGQKVARELAGEEPIEVPIDPVQPAEVPVIPEEEQ